MLKFQAVAEKTAKLKGLLFCRTLWILQYAMRKKTVRQMNHKKWKVYRRFTTSYTAHNF